MAEKNNKLVSKKPEGKLKEVPMIKLTTDRDIAFDFATKTYQKFDKMVKSIVLFGSVAKDAATIGSDIDLVLIIDDASIKFDEELISWYREELKKLIQENEYKKELHITTIRLTTWWDDLLKGDPTVINVLRYGETVIDLGGFFNPLKILLKEGRIKLTPESMFNCLQRVPNHLANSRSAELNAIEGVYWAFVDAAHALLMSIKLLPPSPEHITSLLKENFSDKKLLDIKYVAQYKEIHELHKKISHGEIRNLEGKIIDDWQKKAEDFFKVSLRLIDKIIE
ncbi:MAG: nucleotidyltransferase domain-containing protein [Candidatus Nanoarchaeia archaeon]